MMGLKSKTVIPVIEASMMAEMRKRLPYLTPEELAFDHLKAEFWKEMTSEMSAQMGTYGLDESDIDSILKRMSSQLLGMKAGKKVKVSRLSGMLQSLEERIGTKTLETIEEVHVGKMLARDMKNQEIKDWDTRRAMSLRG